MKTLDEALKKIKKVNKPFVKSPVTRNKTKKKTIELDLQDFVSKDSRIKQQLERIGSYDSTRSNGAICDIEKQRRETQEEFISLLKLLIVCLSHNKFRKQEIRDEIFNLIKDSHLKLHLFPEQSKDEKSWRYFRDLVKAQDLLLQEFRDSIRISKKVKIRTEVVDGFAPKSIVRLGNL